MGAAIGTIPYFSTYQPGALPIASTVYLEIVDSLSATSALSYNMSQQDLVGKAPAIIPNANPVASDRFAFFQVSSGLPKACTLGNFGVPFGNVPTGGTAGQMLVKLSATNFDAGWSSIIQGPFGVVGNVTMTGIVNVLGSTIITGSVNILGTSTITGAFGVIGTSTLTGTFGVVGTALMTGVHGIVGTTLVTGSFGVVGTSNLTGVIGIVGTATLSGGLARIGEGNADTGISIISNGTKLSIFDGTSGGPYQSSVNPSVFIYRNESNAAAFNGYSAALNVGVTNADTTSAYQTSAIIANAAKAASSLSDVVAIQGNGYHFGVSGTAFGAFFTAANRGSGNSIAIETTTGNGTGVDKPYLPTPGSALACGIDIDYNGIVSGSVSALGGAAVQIRSGSNQWDVGVGFMNGGPIKSADIRTDSTATTILYAGPTGHVNGIDLSNATFSGSPFKSLGFSVSSTGAITSIGTDAGTTGPVLSLYHSSPSPAALDQVGRVRFYGNNSAAAQKEYGEIGAQILSTTAGAEYGCIVGSAMSSGVLSDTLLGAETFLLGYQNPASNNFEYVWRAPSGKIAYMYLESFDPGATGPSYNIWHNSASQAAADIPGAFVVDGNAANGTTYVNYSRVDTIITNASTTGAGAAMVFKTVGSAVMSETMRIDDRNNLVIGTAAIASAATNGFLYLPTTNGTPTGTPTTYAGRVPIVFDTSNNKIWLFNSTWKGVVVA